MSRPVRIEVEVAGHVGHVFASRRSADTDDAGATAGAPGRDAGTKGSAEPAQGQPAVVLIHGIGASHRYLERLHRNLAATLDTYSIDLPGFGATPEPDHTLNAAEQATYIIGALERLGVLDFVIVGHSMGTQFATEVAVQQPARVRYVVLMGPVVNYRKRTVARQALALGRDCLFFESPSSNAVVLTDYLRCGPSWYLKNLRVMMDYRLEDRIMDVSAPILVLRGEHDPVATRDWCHRLAARAAAGAFLEIEGTGHVVQHNKSVEVAEAILRFAGRTETASATEPAA
ncbi:alpha/beta hydrolase [Arthrobacter sp. YD4]|uniref:alpha/beta fold hydrolase n=1 Tax=Arthrobacter sp. YD4 TaxID=3058043 RepID=UPI0025B33D4F|nr:alpha/beta hydrolase [Arthrobacter sp. YD4]MDN3935284.1 alpha/beta hydrolase [Arthrobacter sp. YD4]